MNFISWLSSIWNQSNTHEKTQPQNTTTKENLYEQRSIEIQERANIINARSNSIAENANSISRRANVIAIIAIIVGLGAVTATLAVFYQTKDSVDAAVKSANVADSEFQLQRTKAFIDSTTNRHKDSTDSSNNRQILEEQKKSIDAQIAQLQEMQKEYKFNHQPLLDYDRTINDSVGEITIFNKGLGIAHVVSVDFIKGSRLGHYWAFLENIFSPNNIVDNYTTTGMPLDNQFLSIERNVDGFEYFGKFFSPLYQGYQNIDRYYCNKLNNTFISPSESKILLKVVSWDAKQMLPAIFEIKYTGFFGDTLTLDIKQYKTEHP